MKKTNKKALYESIMKNVSKIVKKHLNESNDQDYIYELGTNIYSMLEEKLDEEDVEIITGYLGEMINTLSDIVEPMVDELSKDDRFDAEVAEWDNTILSLKGIFKNA